MIPQLQATYGGDPMGWFAMPICVLEAYVTMLPRVRAEQSMRQAEVVLYGTATASKESRAAIYRGWRSALNQRHANHLTEEAKLARLGEVGITVE